jgi:multiple sugar transport system substrate-binding protein
VELFVSKESIMKKIFHLFREILPLFLLAFLCGCPQTKSDPTAESNPRPFSGVKLTLQIVDDPQMAKAIERLRGEWNAQSGSEFEILQGSEKELAEAENLPADAVICPSDMLGPLAEKKLLAEVPEKVRSGRPWADVFELSKLREASWAGKIYGLSFGSPVFTIYYRADLLEKLHRTPPKTWPEYLELAKLLAAEKPSASESPWHGTLEPLVPGWAGLTLLARAAPYAKHRNNYSTWFDIQTMEPRIANPPVVQALTKLVEAAKTNGNESSKCDPAAVRRAFWAGQCGMAITWPTASEKNGKADSGTKTEMPKESFQVGFIELPGSRQVYSPDGEHWEVRPEEESPYVPFIGIAGRLGVVGAKSPSRDAAFALLEWLSDNQNSRQICPASTATTLFRKSQVDAPQLWTEKTVSPAAAAQYAESTSTTLNREIWLDLRLPGREEYLAALDEAVQSALEGKATPADALANAAEKWRQITEKFGLEQQKIAYLHSLGLD